MAKYKIRDAGKNGKVEIFPDRIVRTREKLVGKDDVQTIPLRAVTAVAHERTSLGTDEVKIHYGSASYKWTVKNAEGLVAELQSYMFKWET